MSYVIYHVTFEIQTCAEKPVPTSAAKIFPSLIPLQKTTYHPDEQKPKELKGKFGKLILLFIYCQCLLQHKLADSNETRHSSILSFGNRETLGKE